MLQELKMREEKKKAAEKLHRKHCRKNAPEFPRPLSLVLILYFRHTIFLFPQFFWFCKLLILQRISLLTLVTPSDEVWIVRVGLSSRYQNKNSFTVNRNNNHTLDTSQVNMSGIHGIRHHRQTFRKSNIKVTGTLFENNLETIQKVPESRFLGVVPENPQEVQKQNIYDSDTNGCIHRK